MLYKSNRILLVSLFIVFLVTNVSLLAQEPETDPGIPLKEVYSLDDLYLQALENSETIKLSEEDLYISEKTKDKAVAVIYPRLTAFGEYVRYSDEIVQRTEIMPGFAIENTVQPEWTTAWGLRLDKSFTLNGRELIAYGIAKDSVVKSEFDLDAVKEEYLLSVAAAYYGVLRGEKTLEIALENVKRLEKHKQAVDSRLKVEEVTKTALYRVQAELSGSRTDLIVAENRLKLARASLGRVVGLSGSFKIEEPAAGIINAAGYDLDSLKTEALAKRAELHSVAKQQKIAEDTVRFVRSDYWPTISLEAGYMKMDRNPESDYDESKYVAAKLNFTIFDGGLRKAEVSEAKALKRKADLAAANLEKEISIAVEKAYLDLVGLTSVLNSLDDQRQYSEANFNAVEKQFKFGLSDSLDVMDANTLLVNAEHELSEAQYRSQLSELRLEREKGVFLNKILERLGMKTTE